MKEEVFSIQGTDKRKDFDEAFGDGGYFLSQKPKGKDVEYFSPETGFCLLNKLTKLNVNLKYMQQAYVIRNFSNRKDQILREVYYTIRQTPDLLAFFNTNTVYTDVQNAINTLEIICDVDRSIFLEGMPKGAFFYQHNRTYGDKKRMILQSEELVTEVVSDYDVRYAMNVFAIEKMAIVRKLIKKSNFSALVNAIISTTGGQYDRSTRKLMQRFENEKNVFSFCDADVWGVYMVQTTQIGSKRSRHLSDKMPNVIDAGVFPSVAKEIGCLNDAEEKRPLNTPQAKKRVELLEYIGYPDVDLDVFKEDNLTFELEALNVRFRDRSGEPIGVQIYLTELLRILKKPCKPQPTEDDEKLFRIFKERAIDGFKEKIREEIHYGSPDFDLAQIVRDKINEVEEKISDEIIEEYLEELKEIVDNISAEEIRDNVKMQYVCNPKREVFNISQIGEMLREKIEVSVNWDSEELAKKIEKTVEEYVENLSDDLYEAEVEFKELDEIDEIPDFYDVVLTHIGANPDDAEIVRKALEKRLS